MARRVDRGSETEPVSKKQTDRGSVVVTGTSTGIGAATALAPRGEGVPRLRGRST